MAIPGAWLTAKQVRGEYSLTEKRLRYLRDQREIRFKKEGNFRYLYERASLDTYFDSGAIEAKPQKTFVEKLVPNPTIKGGGNKMLRWKTEPSGRNRANCGDFSLIESKGKRGINYYMDWFDGQSRRTKGLSKLAKSMGVEVRPISDRAMAFEVARRVRNELYKQAENPKKVDKTEVTFDEFAEEKYLNFIRPQKKVNVYKQIKNVVSGRLVPFFGKYRLVDLDFSKTAEYVDMLREEGIKDSTIKNHLSIFKRILNIAIKFDHDVNAKKVVIMGDFNLRESERRRELKKEECDRLYAKASDLWKDLLTFALNTGLRLGNVCNLKWTSVNFESENIVIAGIESKNKKAFKIWMNPTVVELLKRMHDANGEHEYVFMRPAKGSGKQTLKERWVQYEFKRLTEEAGVDDLHFHDLRHTFGRRLADNGINLLVIQQAMAHKSIQSTLCYVRANEDHVREAFQTLDENYWDNGVNSRSKL